jgi:glycosyltransferase involved in cell wall biosynthesis
MSSKLDSNEPFGGDGHRPDAPPSVAVVFATDFDRISAGGGLTIIREVLSRLSDRFNFLFVGVGDADRVDEIRERIGAPNVMVLPVLPARRKLSWIPVNLAFIVALLFSRKRIIQRAGLIHSHRMEATLPFVLMKARPVLLTVHGSSEFHTLPLSGLFRFGIVRRVYNIVEEFVFSRVDKIILVSKAPLSYYCRRYSQSRHKFVVIPNFIDIAECQSVDRSEARALHGLAADEVAIVYVGRLVREKRVDLLITAFATLLRDRPVSRLFIAGEGPEDKPLRQQAARLGLSSVQFLGLLPKDGIYRLLRAADCLVLPSFFEAFPMVVLEALACGVPVVASDVGSVREMLGEGLDRFILGSGDPDELKQKILQAADRREEVRDLCIRRASQYDSRVVLPQIESLYRELSDKTIRG